MELDKKTPATDTKREHIKRDVHVKVAAIKLGADTGKV